MFVTPLANLAHLRLARWATGLLTLLLLGCTPADQTDALLPPVAPEATSPLVGEILVTGSSTMAPLILEMAQRFESLHPGILIDVQTGGSGKGIADVRSEIAQIAMASRQLKGDEQALLSTTIARDGVGLIVHASNPLPAIDRQQVVDIYQDRLNNWSQLGGSKTAILVIHKAEGRATLEVFLEHFAIQNPSIQADVIVGENEHAIKSVVSNPGAVGYVSIGSAEAAEARGEALKLLKLDGVVASTENVANGTYPMSRPLNLVTQPQPTELVRQFVQYCLSGEVHDLIRKQYFVPTSTP